MSDLIDRQAAIDALNECRERTERSEEFAGLKIAVGVMRALPSAQPERKPIEFPNICITEGYDSIEDENGNKGFGVYVPDEKQIYVAGAVPYEVLTKALFHEIAHWVQDETGNKFDEDEANDFAEKIYNTLPSAQPETVRCKDCLMHGVCRLELGLGENGFCSQAERREDGSD